MQLGPSYLQACVFDLNRGKNLATLYYVKKEISPERVKALFPEYPPGSEETFQAK